MFVFFIYLTHFLIFHFAKDSNNMELENEVGDNYEWQNRVYDETVYAEDNNEGYASGQYSALDYFEQHDDVETQYSEENDDNAEGNFSIDYDEINEVSEDMQNNSCYVEKVCNNTINFNNEGVASRKDKESRSSSIRPVAFNFQDLETKAANQQSNVDPVNSYICPASIHDLETQYTRQRPPSKGPPLKRQMTTQAQTTQSAARQGITPALATQSSVKANTPAQTTQSAARQGITPALATQSSVKANTPAQTTQSTPRQGITPALATQSSVKANTPAQTTQSTLKPVTIRGQNSKQLPRGMTTQGQTSQALTRQTTHAQISESSEKEEITQVLHDQPITRQATTRSTNPFAQKWM
jgi:hypothetical protein